MLRLYNNSVQVSYRTVRTVQLVMFRLLLRTWCFLHVSPTYATSPYKPWTSGQQLGSTLSLEFRPLCQVESASNRTNHLASFSSLFFQKFKTLISYQFWERFVSELVITYFLSKKGIDYQMLWHLWRGLKTPLLTSSLHMTVVYLGYVADSFIKRRMTVCNAILFTLPFSELCIISENSSCASIARPLDKRSDANLRGQSFSLDTQ